MTIPRDIPLEFTEKSGAYLKIEYDAGMRVWVVHEFNSGLGRMGHRMTMSEEEVLHRYPKVEKYCKELMFNDEVKVLVNEKD